MFDWKITKVSVEDGAITHAHYVCKLIQEPFTVETEGNWYFSDKIIKKPFEQVKEQDITNWIEKESMQNGISTIKLRLEEQMESLHNAEDYHLPWLPKTFKFKG
jgi:hypothetical protein